jgi:hypothetical protein
MLDKKKNWRENSSVSKIEYLARLMILEDKIISIRLPTK